MKNKIFLQIFILTLICISVLFAYGISAVTVNSKNIIKQRLAEETKLAASLVQTVDDFSVFSNYYNDDSFRITIIDLEGNVLFESDTKSFLENHIDREEIRNAIKNKPKAVERYSDTFRCEMTYYALKSKLNDGTKIILRMALKSSQINSYVIITLPIYILILCWAICFSLMFSKIISKKITNKITDVGKSLRSLNTGNYKPIKTSSNEPELFSVLNEINELNSSIYKHIKLETEQRNKLNIVLENIAQGILAVNKKNKIIFANKSILNIFKCTENTTNKDIVFLIDDLSICEYITQNLGQDSSTEFSFDGKTFSIVIKKIDDIIESDEISSIIIFTDITQEKEIARQKSEFFDNASHELKTPVAVMQGLSELLLAKNLDDSSKKQIERINKESMRLSSLISDMLNLSKLENGQTSDLKLTNINLKEVTEEIINELSTKIAEKNITTTISGYGFIEGDNKKIYELIENLCSNAINYNKENGKIDIIISEINNHIQLKISDTGIGIEKENIPRLCQRFYRVDKSHSKETGGTGLGLAIVKHICALHNATLSIESDLGLGSTVSVLFDKSKQSLNS